MQKPYPKVRPLDREDPAVKTAREAERRAYRQQGLEPEEHCVEVEDLGCTIRVLTVGSGPPAVLIPGGHGPGFIWIPLLSELEEFTTYVMDRPGGGLSDGIDYRSVPLRRQAASSTKALFDQCGLEEAPIIGNSMGGLWTLRFALAHPERAGKLAFLGCPAVYPGTSAPFSMRLGSVPGLGGLIVRHMMRSSGPEEAREALEFMGHPRETAERLPEAFAETWYRMEQMPHYEATWTSLLPAVLSLRGANPEAAFSSADLEAIRSEVLLIWGSEDPFGTVEAGRAGASHFRDAAFHEVGIGHLPWLDKPARCGALIREFLET